MSGGGTASGPVSFMRGYDAFAGVVKSGGKTRRAAKMVILDVDHPDIEDFINCKLKEEKKAWALIEAGYDASFTGEAYGSVAFQNANHSVRVTDDFMRAVVADGPWTTHAVVGGAPMDTYRARALFREMADAAWVCGDPGIQYDTTINDWNPVSNSARQYATNPCSEYSFLNDSSCNLASLNLMKFVRDDGEFDVEGFRYACRLTITAQEILVDNASYPTPKIGDNSHLFRPLGLGYANLGALLMNRGLAYDSPEGQAYAGAITSVMTAEAYRQSAIVARDHGGPFAEYRKNEEPFLCVIEKHRDAAHGIPDKHSVPADLHRAARDIWDETLSLGRQHGFRNAQTTLLAPTGTISFMMDCDTTGIEPDIALVKYKKLVGEGFLKIVNQTVPGALRKLGYTPEQVDAIVAYVNERETIEGAPELRPEHLPVFDCAFKPMNGTRSIHYMGHLRMMSAVQPFLSGAISKTVNMPEAATPEEIETVYLEGWRMGLKAIAIYRDNSKRSQPLMTGKKKEKELELAAPVAASASSEPKPYRRRLPAERAAITHKFDISGHEGYITVGLYEDGQPGEIFLKMAKEGSTISGLMDTFATTVSVALQYGVPLHDLVHKFAHVRFEPSGFTSNPEIPIAKSIVDYIFRWLGSRFLPPEDRATLGLVERSATAESSVQPLNLGLGGSDAAGSGGAGTSGSGSGAVAPSGAPGPASPLSGDAGKAGPTTVVAAPDSTPVAGEPPAREWPNDSPRSTASPASGSGNVTAPGKSNGNGNGSRVTLGTLGIGKAQVTFAAQADAPSCAECGSIMVRNGSCYKCLNCGSTSGCS
jgi:ribonucleoside-diphosphate reductase alpha chain